ncbi:MAG: hypothetical protein AB7L65_01580 [Hyphomonadaceae bacterium]
MAATQKGKRDLSLVRESGSTTRVLNLALVQERFGNTPEYLEKPLFKNRRLNAALILKHTLRPNEREFAPRRGTTATKIVLPYSASDLSLGGTSFFVGQPNFERLLKDGVGGYADAGVLLADLDTLNIIDELPSFDPFLLRELLRRHGHEPARCYFDLSEADTQRMRVFVEQEISRLVELAFASNAGGSARSLSARLAEKLMTDETAQSLEPLRATLQLSGDEYREGVFAWKGFLYYNWLVGEFAPRLGVLARQILSASVRNATSDERMHLANARQHIVDLLGVASGRVREGLRSYTAAYNELAAGKPTAFRDFLLRAPALFLSVGESISVLMHIEAFWRYRFKAGKDVMLEADEAMEIFQEFESTLSGVE